MVAEQKDIKTGNVFQVIIPDPIPETDVEIKEKKKKELLSTINIKGTIEIYNILVNKNIIKKTDISKELSDLIDLYNLL